VSLNFPLKGRPKDEILADMRTAKQRDVRWQEGKAFSLVFHAGPEIDELLKEAYELFFSENGLNPTAFPSLRKFETEVVAMAASLLGGEGGVAGNLTSGGTESLLLAVKTARDWARRHRPEIERPEIVLPVTAHPAFDKAAHYFGLTAVHVPVRPDFRADIQAVEQAITPNTILLVGSAPSYPQGVVDPIAALAELAQSNGLLCHVDACVGGFMLPFVRRLGYPVPAFDFQVPGVTSISADLHKYGYAAKGASVILYREAELRRRQFFVYTDWPGGIYPSPTMVGTRPGGAIAAAWAVMNYLGEEGYLAIAGTVMETVGRIQAGIASIPCLQVLSNPEMSVMAIGSDRLNIYAVGDEMSLRGWHLDRQQFPPSLHLTVNYAHCGVVEDFLRDLAASVESARKPSWEKLKAAGLVRLAHLAVRLLPEKTVSRLMGRAAELLGIQGSTLPGRSAAMYGLMGTLPNRGDLNELVLDLLDSMTRE
jgi:glutamate/tyrosine decarboxylase-like PLP-dependent enzyme